MLFLVLEIFVLYLDVRDVFWSVRKEGLWYGDVFFKINGKCRRRN